MIETEAFGNTGHNSTRVVFGAAALGAMRQERADAVLETLLEFGINHLDCAASYGFQPLELPQQRTSAKHTSRCRMRWRTMSLPTSLSLPLPLPLPW